MAQAICASCTRLFTVRPQSPTQTFCSEPECQHRRRQAWDKHKPATDPDYQANQRAAQQAWRAHNPDYSHFYRLRRKRIDASSPQPSCRANSDASFCGADASAGLCWIEINSHGDAGQPMTWRVEIFQRNFRHCDRRRDFDHPDAPPGRLNPRHIGGREATGRAHV